MTDVLAATGAAFWAATAVLIVLGAIAGVAARIRKHPAPAERTQPGPGPCPVPGPLPPMVAQEIPALRAPAPALLGDPLMRITFYPAGISVTEDYVRQRWWMDVPPAGDRDIRNWLDSEDAP